MKLIKNKFGIEADMILAVESMGQLIIGKCTGITTYPGDKVWFFMKPNDPSVGVAIGQVKDLKGEEVFLQAGGGFFGFDKNRVFDVTPELTVS